MIVVIDYNVGNVKSVCNAFAHIGCPSKLSCDAGDIAQAAGLVLPGVAAFGYAVAALGGLAGIVKDVVLAGKPLLGICVGYQLLFDKSFEHGEHKGLGLIGGEVAALPVDNVVPHMGWNKVEWPVGMDLFDGLGDAKHFYFAHSYYSKVNDSEAKVAYTEYGFQLPASVQKGNIYGTQFHPEKSGAQGLDVLRNFAAICERNI